MIMVMRCRAQSEERAQFVPLLCRVRFGGRPLATPRINIREVIVLLSHQSISVNPSHSELMSTMSCHRRSVTRADPESLPQFQSLSVRWPPIDYDQAAAVACTRNDLRDTHSGVICRLEHQNHVPVLLKREKER